MKASLNLIIFLFAVIVPWTSTYLLNGKGVVLPDDPYVYIGKELVMMCNLTQPIPEDSSSLYFTRKANEIIPRKYISVLSTRSIQLRILITGPQDEGIYVCKLNKSSGASRPDVIGSQFVRVDYQPKAVNAINCQVFNWQNMTCNWDLGVEYVHPELISVTLVWTVDGGQYDCVHPTPTSCEWKEIEESGKGSFKANMIYYMTVFVKNTKTNDEKRPYKMFKIDTSKIVRPASITDVETKHNSTCIDVKWSHPDRYHDKVYRIQYLSQWDTEDTWKEVTLNNQQSITLCNLIPYTSYAVKISSRPQSDGFWSDSVAKTIMMSEDVPAGAPEILAGSYVEKKVDKDYYKVLLYWKPIDKKLSNGKIMSYRIICHNIDLGTKDTSLVSDDFQSGWLLLKSQYNYEIEMRGETAAGVSPHASSLILPLKNKKPGYPTDLYVDHVHTVGQDRRVVNIRWHPGHVTDEAETITGYTVYWCKGPHNVQQCRKPLMWQKVPADKTEVTIEMDIDIQLIGVSMETSYGSTTVSSGIVWNNCIYRKHSKPTLPPSNFHLNSDQLKLSITVEWDQFQCHENQGYIHQYLIYICQIHRGDNCTDPAKVISVGGHLQKYEITDLTPEVRYKVWMQAVSDGGIGPSSIPMYANIHIYGLQAEEIGGIAVAIILVVSLAIVGVVFCVRRMVGVMKDLNKDYPIILPNIPLPQRPMPELPRSQSSGTDSDSDGIYEKINEHNDSSTPSTPESSINVPLINNNNYSSKCSNMMSRSQLHGDGCKKDLYGKGNCTDSGRSSMVSNPESLWSRLHPLRVSLDSKQYGYGRNKNMGTFGHHYKQKRPPHCRRKLHNDKFVQASNVTEENISPYSCVDIINSENSDVVSKITALGKNMLKCHPVTSSNNTKSECVGHDALYTDDNNLIHSVGSVHSDTAYVDHKGIQSIISTHSDPTYSYNKDNVNSVSSLTSHPCSPQRHVFDRNNSLESEYLYPKNNLSRTPSKNKPCTACSAAVCEQDISLPQHFNIQPDTSIRKNSFKGILDKSSVNDKNTTLSLDDLLDSSGARKKISSDFFENCNECEEKSAAISMDQLDSVPFDLNLKLRKTLDESVDSVDKNTAGSVDERIYDESWDKSCPFSVPGTSYCRVDNSGEFDILNPRFKSIPHPQKNDVEKCSKLAENSYLKHFNMTNGQNNECCGNDGSSESSVEKKILIKPGPRPLSIVKNIPANFYASLSALEMGMATEL